MDTDPDQTIPTLDDVARAAGVSTATVSRCLNRSEKVSEETRKKVLKAVDALGYTPNFGARAMAAKRTFTIGAIIPTMENAIFARGIQAFQEELHEKGYTLLVSSTAYRPEREEEQIRSLVARGADGLLLIGYERRQATYDYLRKRGIPALITWSYEADHPWPSIGFDNRHSMRVLTDHILSLGHRHVAMISGIVEGNDRAKGRVTGVLEGLRSSGIDKDQVQIVEVPYEIEHGASALETLMAHFPRPTVVICANDVLAVGAIQRAREMGLNVPGDVSITGFDDIELASIVTPRLTTVQVPHRDMGHLAADELIRMIEEKAEGLSSELKCTLRLRGSLGPPPA